MIELRLPTIHCEQRPSLQEMKSDCFFSASAESVPSPNDVSYLDSYGALAKRQPTGGARTRQVEHVAQRERVWRARQRRHRPDAKRGAGDCSLQGNRQHTPPAARPALGG